MDERTFTYDELAMALGKSHEATRAMCIRKRWRRTIGNDGKARITVPVEAVEAHRTPDIPRAPTPPYPEHSPDVLQDTSAEPNADARTLGGVDGFDEDEAESKCNNGAVVLGRLLAAERDTFEPLELANELLDAGAGAIERFRKEPW